MTKMVVVACCCCLLLPRPGWLVATEKSLQFLLAAAAAAACFCTQNQSQGLPDKKLVVPATSKLSNLRTSPGSAVTLLGTSCAALRQEAYGRNPEQSLCNSNFFCKRALGPLEAESELASILLSSRASRPNAHPLRRRCGGALLSPMMKRSGNLLEKEKKSGQPSAPQ